MPGMSRREFITLFGGAAATWPLAARAQQGKRLPVIAMVYSIGAAAEMARVDPLGVNMRAFERGLRDLGWIDGRNGHDRAAIQRGPVPTGWGHPSPRWSHAGPDVILLGGARWLHEAALRATNTIPHRHAVRRGPRCRRPHLGLARPGGNVIGVMRTTDRNCCAKSSSALAFIAALVKRLPLPDGNRAEALDAFQAVRRLAASWGFQFTSTHPSSSTRLFRTSYASALTPCWCRAVRFSYCMRSALRHLQPRTSCRACSACANWWRPAA